MTWLKKPIPLALEREDKRRKRLTREADAKRDSKQRDGYRCRWPKCEYAPMRPRLESAHIDAKGMGGDHGVRTTTANLLTTCFLHHRRAVKSLHSGDLKVKFLTKAKCDGPLEFFEDGRSVGRETAPGILERV